MSKLSLEALELCYAIERLPKSEQAYSILKMAVALHRKIAEQSVVVPVFVPQGVEGACPKCGASKPTYCRCPPEPIPLRETQKVPDNTQPSGGFIPYET